MKILCVSDTIVPQLESAANLRRRHAYIDLVVSCGDMPAAYLEFITSVLSVPLFYVRGNHDEGYRDRPPGGQNLHLSVLHYKGLTFTGIEGCMRYNKGEIQYTDAEVNRMVMGMAPRLLVPRLKSGRAIDILVTHSPPKGIHDRDDLPHRGWKALLTFMDWYRPRYMLHGHVHTYDRRDTVQTVYNQTVIWNVNPYMILEVEPEPESE